MIDSTVGILYMFSEISNWESTQISRIEQELGKEREKKIENIKRITEDDIKEIASKLESELEEKKAAMFSRNKKAINVSILVVSFIKRRTYLSP